MIVSKIVEIDRVEDVTTKYVEAELATLSIEPVRWAIVEVREKTLVISLACFQ